MKCSEKLFEYANEVRRLRDLQAVYSAMKNEKNYQKLRVKEIEVDKMTKQIIEKLEGLQ